MTVRTSPAIVFVPGADCYFEHRGVKWGIKVTDTPDVDLLTLFVWDGANWALGAQLSGFNWEDEMKARGSIRAWLRTDVLPKVNAWLAATFPATGGGGGGGGTPPAGTLAEQLDAILVKELRVTVNPDGTLTATLP